MVHRAAWEQLAHDIGAPFDEAIAERMKGVDRRGSLEIVLERAPHAYSEREKRALKELLVEVHRNAGAVARKEGTKARESGALV